MKQTYNTICRYLLIVLLAASPIMAAANPCNDGPRRFSPEEYMQQCDAFITREANLTPTEAQRFFAVYHQMKDEQRKLHKELFDCYRATLKGELSDKDAVDILNKSNAIQKKQIDIEESYQKKFLKIIPATKLLKVKIAEKRFERQMLGGMYNKRGKHNKKD